MTDTFFIQFLIQGRYQLLRQIQLLTVAVVKKCRKPRKAHIKNDSATDGCLPVQSRLSSDACDAMKIAVAITVTGERLQSKQQHRQRTHSNRLDDLQVPVHVLHVVGLFGVNHSLIT